MFVLYLELTDIDFYIILFLNIVVALNFYNLTTFISNKYYIAIIPDLYDRVVVYGEENQLDCLNSFSEDVVKRFLEIERERCFLLKDFYRPDSFLFGNKVDKEKLMWKKHNSYEDAISALKFSLEFINMMNNDTLSSINSLQKYIMNIINGHEVYSNDRGAIL